MPKIVNLIDRTFGLLKVISISNKTDKARHKYWLCRCSCGKLTECRGNGLLRGYYKSCGCLRIKSSRERMTILNHKQNGIIDKPKHFSMFDKPIKLPQNKPWRRLDL